jgi:hypothetical protein
MAPLPGTGGVAVTWLDGREASAMSLRYAELDAALGRKSETLLDARVCECCGTGMTMTAKGPVIAYRDRSGEEMRDIAFIRRANGKWSNPSHVRRDNWKVPGCPVNGPQLDARGDRVALAWFTAAENKPLVQVAFSSDAAATFGRSVRVDTGNAVGRVDVLMLNDGSALVTWIEGSSIFVRRVHPDGRAETPVKLADTSSARASGFPRAALLGNTAYFAWTDPAAKTVKLQSLAIR